MTNREYIAGEIKVCDKRMKRARMWGEIFTWYARIYTALMLLFIWGAIQKQNWWTIPFLLGCLLINVYLTLWKHRTRRRWSETAMRWANVKDEWVTLRAQGELTKAWWLEEEHVQD